MNDNFSDLMIQSLPAALIVSNFIKGIEPYSYEDYLTEYVNASKCFLIKSDNEKYLHPVDESHGECDCISEKYQLDFKLLVSKTQMQGKSLFDSQIIQCSEGVVTYCVSKMNSSNPEYKPIKATRIFAALRGLNEQDLINLRTQKNLYDIDKDIQQVLLTLETAKNLLLFFPYVFYYEKEIIFEQAIQSTVDAVNSDFSEVLKYREKVCPSLDTYLCYLLSGHFIITQWTNDSLRFVEAVPLDSSPTFNVLLDYSDDFLLGSALLTNSKNVSPCARD